MQVPLTTQGSSQADSAQAPSQQVKEYTLDSGAVVRDKTNGIGQVIFLQELSFKLNKNCYHVLINDKKIIFPTNSDPSKALNITFSNSLKFSFKQKDEFIQITERDPDSKTVFFVDPRSPVEGIAYDAYNYLPKELSLEEAKEKIHTLKTDFPNFDGDMIVFNRHGIAVFGYEKGDKEKSGYALCWASPHQDKVVKIACKVCERYRDGGSSFAKSADGNVNFRYALGGGFYLNAEPATRITLTQ